MKNSLPTVSQIREVKHLHSTYLFGPVTIAQMTDVPLRDVFRIIRSMFPPVTFRPDGTVPVDQRRVIAVT